jgi:acyl-coenzyme A synthetase/AMP-(fatty) acid ligase
MGWVQQSVESFGSILLTKIRGYRVELAEVETALLDLENIQEAVVVDGDDSLGEKRLIAYLVCDTHLPVSFHFCRHLSTLEDFLYLKAISNISPPKE